jgi:hypothetical protein
MLIGRRLLLNGTDPELLMPFNVDPLCSGMLAFVCINRVVPEEMRAILNFEFLRKKKIK